MIENITSYLKIVASVLFSIFSGVAIWKFMYHDRQVNIKELSQVAILFMLGYIVYKDATRTHEWQLFSDVIYLILIIGLFSMSELKDVVALIRGIKGLSQRAEPKEENTNTN
jgi:hypothetical protein